MTSKYNTTAHEIIVTPRPDDVLCGRGGLVNKHNGNLNFRKWVGEFKEKYHASTDNYEKTQLSLEIVAKVKGVGGRFLSKYKEKHWIEVDDNKATAKAKQALRDGPIILKRKAADSLDDSSRLRDRPKVIVSSSKRELRSNDQMSTRKRTMERTIEAPIRGMENQKCNKVSPQVTICPSYEPLHLLACTTHIPSRLFNDVIESDQISQHETFVSDALTSRLTEDDSVSVEDYSVCSLRNRYAPSVTPEQTATAMDESIIHMSPLPQGFFSTNEQDANDNGDPLVLSSFPRASAIVYESNTIATNNPMKLTHSDSLMLYPNTAMTMASLKLMIPKPQFHHMNSLALSEISMDDTIDEPEEFTNPFEDEDEMFDSIQELLVQDIPSLTSSRVSNQVCPYDPLPYNLLEEMTPSMTPYKMISIDPMHVDMVHNLTLELGMNIMPLNVIENENTIESLDHDLSAWMDSDAQALY